MKYFFFIQLLRENRKNKVSETSANTQITTSDLSFEQLDGTNNSSDPGEILISNLNCLITLFFILLVFYCLRIKPQFFFQVTQPTTDTHSPSGKPTSPDAHNMNPDGSLTGEPKPQPDPNPQHIPSPTPDHVKPDPSKNGDEHKPAGPKPPAEHTEPDQTTPGPKPDSVPPEPVRSKKEWMKSNFLKYFSIKS